MDKTLEERLEKAEADNARMKEALVIADNILSKVATGEVSNDEFEDFFASSIHFIKNRDYSEYIRIDHGVLLSLADSLESHIELIPLRRDQERLETYRKLVQRSKKKPDPTNS